MNDDPIKDVLRMMPYGFYVVTSRSGDDVNVMVATWISQVSFEPRMVALALQKDCYTHDVVEQGRVFAINFFRTEDQEIVKSFSKSRARDPEKVEDANYSEAPVTGCPVIEGAAAYLENNVIAILDVGGDHDIVVGKVVGAGMSKPGEMDATLSLADIGWHYAG
jgi:flavin reductase (DIM6/NTAB) family NADH-FMN oxidoreductase RutF